MVKFKALLVCLVLALGLFSCGLVKGAAGVGVRVGDSFRYGFSVEFSSTNSSEPVPLGLVRDNETAWIRYTITSVSDSTVGYSVVQAFRNGSQVTTSDSTNVLTGSGGFLIARGGLEVGDLLFTSSESPAVVTETVSRSFSGGVRQVNHANWTETDYNDFLDNYFDKVTGMPIELQVSFQASYFGTATYNYVLLESSVWAVPEFPVFVVPVVLVLAVSFGAIAFRKKRLWRNSDF